MLTCHMWVCDRELRPVCRKLKSHPPTPTPPRCQVNPAMIIFTLQKALTHVVNSWTWTLDRLLSTQHPFVAENMFYIKVIYVKEKFTITISPQPQEDSAYSRLLAINFPTFALILQIRRSCLQAERGHRGVMSLCFDKNLCSRSFALSERKSGIVLQNFSDK